MGEEGSISGGGGGQSWGEVGFVIVIWRESGEGEANPRGTSKLSESSVYTVLKFHCKFNNCDLVKIL